MIDAKNIHVELSGRKILRGVDFCAQSTELTVVLGPNGSGKTTLLRALTGELEYSGSIAINGRDLAFMSAGEQAELRGVLPQSSALAFPFTVREVVDMGRTTVREVQSSKASIERVETQLERVGLNGFAGRHYTHLSGGEKQRVQFARVLHQIGSTQLDEQPKWLFLDEPVSSLDIKHQLHIMHIATRFAHSGGGVVAVLHDLNLAAMFADQIVILKDGQVAQKGIPKDALNTTSLREIFECELNVGALPMDDAPFVLPHSAISESQNG
ncbi:MAG: heme ABC transporter ATP-binding protein [Pseudomonadota bacterium]